MVDKTIEDLVRGQLQFKSVSGQGWNTLYCEVCGDGNRTKGPRGGWRFDGESCFYHCFNCGINANFSTEREHPYSKNMWRVFEAFGINEKDHKAIAYKNLDKKSFDKPKKKEMKFEEIQIPDHFYKLTSTNNAITDKARKFLEARLIDPESYPFFLSTGISKQGPREEAIAKAMFNRLIIPAYHKDTMIYYQARILEEHPKKGKYLNPSIPRANIIYGYDKLFHNTDMPLYITEGFFDSYHLDGVAILENKLSQQQIDMLSRSHRRKILVPDKKDKKDQKQFDDGKELIRQAIDLGWEVAFPSYGECNDVTKAIQTYGRLQIFNSISENIKSGFSASISLKFW